MITMHKKIAFFLLIALSGVILSISFAKMSVQITGKKINFVILEDDKNPYLYDDKLKTVQNKLNRVLSFNLKDYQPIRENGFWNKETEAALNQFQEMYYKKYHLQRYYAFSASESPSITAAEGLLDKEAPNPAGFVKKNVENMKLKLGDPAIYYGNSANAEIRRIENGLNGDFVDPVTGELSKNIPIYGSPVKNDHLLPIQLVLRYGSQYSGNPGLGHGWFVTENSSLWYSFEKNEVIIQDPSGINQKFELMDDGIFISKGERTDGGYFLDVSLQGEMGIKGSKITAKTANDQTLEFTAEESSGGDSVEDVLRQIDSIDQIHGYKIDTDIRGLKSTNVITNAWATYITNVRSVTKYPTNAAPYTVNETTITLSHSNWTITTNIVDSNQGVKLVGGYFDDPSGIMERNDLEELHAGNMNVAKGDVRNAASQNLKNNGEYGWSVTLFAGVWIGESTNVFITAGYSNQGGTYTDAKTNIIYRPIYGNYKIYSFRRNPAKEPSVYAGYVMTSVSNRFGSKKTYSYDSYQKLVQIASYSPGGKMVDQAAFIYRNSGGSTNRGQGLTDEELRDTKSSVSTEPVGSIIAGMNHQSITADFAYGNTDRLNSIIVSADGKSLVYNMNYNTVYLADINSPEIIKLRNSLLSNQTELRKGILDLNNQITSIRDSKKKYDSESGIKEDYFDEQIIFLQANLVELNKNLAMLDQQIIDCDSGKMFPKLSLMRNYSENGKKWNDYGYTNVNISDFNSTNKEVGVRLRIAVTPYGNAEFGYAPGITEYKNLRGKIFKMYYDQSQTNYTYRRINKFFYPNSTEVRLDFDTKGNIVSVINELGKSYTYSYDPAGNVLTRTLPDGKKWTYTYDHPVAKFLSRPTRISQPGNIEITMEYEGLGEITRQAIHNGSENRDMTTVAYQYHADRSYSKTVRDQNHSITVYDFDTDHNLLRSVNPDGGIYNYISDSFGATLEENRDGKAVYFYQYDSKGNVVYQGIKGVMMLSNQYNEWGNKIKSIDPLGYQTEFQYDTGCRLVRIYLPSMQAVTYGYDAEGNKTEEAYISALDNQKKVYYAFDSLNRMTNKTLWQGDNSPHNYNYSYEYDSVGNIIKSGDRLSVLENLPHFTLYSYDDAGQITNQTDLSSGLNVGMVYDDAGRLVTEIRSKGADTYVKKTDYDILSRPVKYLARKNTGDWVTLSSIKYNENNSSEKTDQYGNVSVTYNDFRNNITNLVYDVFDPLKNANETCSHAYFYDTLGNKVKEKFPDGSIQEWTFINGTWPEKTGKRRFENEPQLWQVNTYDRAGHVISVLDENGEKWVKEYSSMGYVSADMDPEGRRTSYQYDIFGDPVFISQALRVKKMSYNLLGKVIEVTHPEGIKDKMIYDGLGNPAVSIPGGNEKLKTVALFDTEGRKIKQINPNGLVTSWEYDAYGNMIAEIAIDTAKDTARTNIYTYDVFGRIVSMRRSGGSETVYTYKVDPSGMLIEKKTFGRTVTETVYDQMNHAVKTTVIDSSFATESPVAYFSGNGLISGTVYNKAGLPLLEIARSGRVRGYVYTGDGKVLIETNEIGETKHNIYGKTGNLQQFTDYEGNTYQYVYDRSGKMTRSQNPDGGATAFSFDDYGNQKMKQNPDGETWKMEIDSRGLLVREENPFGGVRTLEYNDQGQPVKETGASGDITVLQYRDDGVIRSVSKPGNVSGLQAKTEFLTVYDIDAFGATNKVINPDGGTIDYQFDPAGRKISVVNGNRYEYGYGYTEENWLDTVTNPEGTVDKYEYYDSGMVRSRYSLTNGTQCQETVYGYGRIFGRIESMEDPKGIVRTNYLDNAGRTVKTVETAGNRSRSTVYEYGVVPIGGLFYRTVISWQLSSGENEEQVNWSKEVKDFRGNTVQVWKKFNGTEILVRETEYNTAGKAASEKTYFGGGQVAMTVYNYDGRGALISKKQPNGLAVSYYYDTAGKVTRKIEANRTSTYEYHPSGAVKKESLANGLQINNYEYDFRGNVVLKTDEISKAVTRNYYDIFGFKTADSVTWGGMTYGKKWEYDHAGRVLKIVNELGGETLYTYDALGNQTSSRLVVSGLVVSSYYNKDGNVSRESRSGSGKRYDFIYQYDAWGNRIAKIFPDGTKDTYQYDDLGRKTNETDRLDYATASVFDENGRKTSSRMITPFGELNSSVIYDLSGKTLTETVIDKTTGETRVFRNEYDLTGNLTSKTLVGAGKNGDIVTRTEYDQFGNKTAETDGNGNTAYFVYDALNRMIQARDAENHVTDIMYEFDGNGNRTIITTLGGISVRENFNGFGNKVRSVDGNGNAEIYSVNAMGKPVLAVNRNGYTNFYKYDAQGRLTAQIDPYGYAVSNVFDAFENITAIIDKEGKKLTHEFDWNNRTVKTIDALGNMSLIEYSIDNKTETEKFIDAEERVSITVKIGKTLLAVIDPQGNKTKYQYNAFGEMTAAIDAKGNITRVAYDRAGNKAKETTSLGFSTIYEYDNNGNLTFEQNGEEWIKTAYNRVNQPVRKEYSDGNVKSFIYDTAGRLGSAADRYSSYNYQYDNAGNLITRQDTKYNDDIVYTYDKAGNRASMTAKGKVVNYRYDGLGQLLLETAVSGNKTNLQVQYEYSPMGRLLKKEFNTGVRSSYEYDALYRLTKINNYTNASTGSPSFPQASLSTSGVFFNSLEYVYDKAGNRTKEIKTEDGIKTESVFGYDASYRLVLAVYEQGKYEKFTYDSCGNRLTRTTESNKTAYTYDNDNRLMLEQPSSGSSVSYVYDKAGRLVKKTEGDNKEYYKYDARDLMVKYTEEKGGVSTVSEYVYDVNNLRTGKTDTSDAPVSMDGGFKRFVYDGDNILFDGSTFYLNNIMINGYEAEIQELRVAVYLKDAIGSIRAEVYDRPVSAPEVNPEAKPFSYKVFEFTAFGEQIGKEKKNGLSYTGHYADKENGLYYARARYYDAGIGRFLTRDPVMDPAKRFGPAGLNVYIYGLNNPLRYTDPTGEWFLIDDLVKLIVGTVIGAINAGISNLDDLLSGKMSFGEYFANINLGGLSGGVSLLLAGNGIPLYFNISTKGYSAGVGFSLGGAVTVGAGVHGTWDGKSVGVGVNAGFGDVTNKAGANLGVSAGVEFGGKQGPTFSLGVSGGIGGMNIGASLNFDKKGFAGFGLNAGFSGSVGNGFTMGGNIGLSFDKNGQFQSMSFGASGGYSGLSKNEFGYSYMSYNESVGFTFGKDGSVSTDASFSATRTFYSNEQMNYLINQFLTTEGVKAAGSSVKDVQQQENTRRYSGREFASSDGNLYAYAGYSEWKEDLGFIRENTTQVNENQVGASIGYRLGDKYLNSGKDYHSGLHRGDYGFFEERIVAGGDNPGFKDEMDKFYIEFANGKYLKNGKLDIEKMNNFIDKLANKYEFAGPRSNDVRWANLFDKGAFYHDLRGALLEHYYDKTMNPYVTSDYHIRTGYEEKFLASRDEYWKNIVESDQALVADARAAMKVRGYGIVDPTGKNKNYQDLYRAYNWGDTSAAGFYGKMMINLFEYVGTHWEIQHNNSNYEYPFLNQNDVIRRVANFK